MDNLSLDFNGRHGPARLLHDVSLKVMPGEVVGLVGESGSGKSLTSLMAPRLLPPGLFQVAGGTVRFEGVDMMAAPLKAVRAMRGRRIAFIFQEPMSALSPAMTIGFQMMDALRVHNRMSRTAARDKCIALLEEMRITEPERVLDAYPFELSGGQRQRVLLAMAFAHDPRLIIADEPTTALDVTVQKQVVDLLKERAAVRGTAVLFITHDLGLMASFCDRAYVMHRGGIVEHGAARALIKAPSQPYTRNLLACLPELATPGRPIVMDAPHGAYNIPHPGGPGVPLLSVEGLCVSYPRRRNLLGRITERTEVLRNVSLSVMAGRTTSIVGESGAGKSTVIKALLGLVPPDRGVIRVNGQEQSVAKMRGDIQVVLQDPRTSLDPRLKVWRIITEPLVIRGERSRAALQARAEELARLVGFGPEVLNCFPHALSGGQRQRVAICRALSVEPRLIILDEPTSALDVSVQARILDILLDLQQRLGLGYLLVSHNLAVVSHMSDRIVVMHRGRVVEDGEARQVLEAPSHAYTRQLVDAAPDIRAYL